MSSDRQTGVMFHTQRGKWGMASFTSTRAIGKIPGQPAVPTAGYAYDNPEDANVVSPVAPVATTPKPRKFFKSRSVTNNSQDPVQTPQPQQQVQPQPSYQSQTVVVATPPEIPVPAPRQPKQSKAKPSKKKAALVQQETAYTQSVPQPEPAQYIPEPSVSQDRIRETIPSKRYLARARKQVNYNEDDNSMPAAPPPPPPPVVAQPMTVPISAISPSMEHPPIVLRISKGTSRLVSTDSEEANNASPPHQTFTSPSSSINGIVKEPPVFVPTPTTTPKTQNNRTRKRRVAAPKPATPDTPPGHPRRTTRAIRRQQEEEELRSEQEQTACEEEEDVDEHRPGTPKPGTENYDLYRTLASSPDVESESQSNSNMIPEPEPVPVADVQKTAPAKRGRKKKVPEPASEPVPVPVPDPVPVPEVALPPQKPAAGRRGRKPKAAAVVVPVVEPAVAEEPIAVKGTPKKQKVAETTESPRRSTRAAAQVTPTKLTMEPEEPRAGAVPEEPLPSTAATKTPPVRSYGRKRKAAVETSKEAATLANTPEKVKSNGVADVAPMDVDKDDMEDKPLVKLVISKKKGSIFKSRALASNDEVAKNRPVYKHKWDVEDEDRNSPKGATTSAGPAGSSSGVNAAAKAKTNAFEGDFDEPDTVAAKPSSSIFKPHRKALSMANSYDAGAGPGSGVANSAFFNDKQTQQKHAAFYTVKQAHQIQEIGEFQEMDDDVEYILDTLQPKYPILTRCLSAMQLSTKCMTPEFRMHVRAHGTVTQFFRVLQDAPKDRSLALCTASILFVLSQDNIGMDLDRDSLELMLNLLDCDEVAPAVSTNADDLGLTEQQAARNKMKVRELCEEVKAQGKAPHLNLDNVTVGALAMETLLSLTSKRAGEWFKEELRNLGGVEHIIKTICECCRQISDYVAVWTEGLLEKLRKIERCLRVLDNVMEMNEQNQQYILDYDGGSAINILVKLYKLCDTELALYPTTAASPKDSPGVAIREALVPTLKVLISLTHSFNKKAVGAGVVGEKAGVFDTSLHLLFHSSNYVPENCVFELSILVLLLLTNMTQHTAENRKRIMEAHALSDFGSQFAKVPAIKALVEFFYKCEESARLAEENADAILDAKPKKEKSRKGDEIEETVTKILQKAGNHMEHTIMASYVCILIGHMVMHDDGHRQKMSAFLRPDAGFAFMAKILEKYYNFMNLTASAEALTVAHIEATKKIIDYLTQCDGN